jgi:hypothetical protein
MYRDSIGLVAELDHHQSASRLAHGEDLVR